MVRSISEVSKRKEKVAHIRFSPAEFDALEAAASAAKMTISAFVRSLSMEGAGVRPFLGESDRLLLGLLADGMRVLGAELKNGLLSIELDRPQPEKLVRKISIAVKE